MRQPAFDGKEKMLKGALHIHTTRSDGNGTPEEVIRYHYEKGYDFLALTDHRVYNFINHAPEVPMTVIPGMEFDNRFETGKGFRTFHTLCLGPSKEDGNGFSHDEKVESGTAKNQEEYQAYLDDIHAKGNLTAYCHPEWSSTPARLFEKMQGDFAMEIWNSGSVINCDMDKDAAYWDEILGQGKKIWGIATDDGHAMNEHCLGWVMVRAENNVNAILEALKNGAFYSTCGPEIYDFRIDGDMAIIECSNVSMIRLHSDMHPTRFVRSENGDLTRAEFNIKERYEYKYVRMSIIDKDGKYAWTNPIFLE